MCKCGTSQTGNRDCHDAELARLGALVLRQFAGQTGNENDVVDTQNHFKGERSGPRDPAFRRGENQSHDVASTIGISLKVAAIESAFSHAALRVSRRKICCNARRQASPAARRRFLADAQGAASNPSLNKISTTLNSVVVPLISLATAIIGAPVGL